MKLSPKPARALLCACAALALFACGTGEGQWANEWGDLTLADFGMYANGGAVLEATDLQTARQYSFGEYAYEGGAQAPQNGEAETLRGVGLGDAPEKVAGLYAGVECAVLDGAGPEDQGEEYTELYTDFAAYLGGEELGRGSVGLTYYYYLVDGNALGLAQFRAWAERGGDMQGAEGYALTFLFRKGVVDGIYLDYGRFGDMIEGDAVPE